MLHKDKYHAIGLMSGSSLDGLDICYVQFQQDDAHFQYNILAADCILYDDNFRNTLRQAPNLTAFELAQLHTKVGKYFGELTQQFIAKNKIHNLDFICSHGQTIFHQPALSFTSQIGCGAQIAAQSQCKVICDLRSSDVAVGGQGAPIVPIAEKYLFPQYSIFLNLGGIANISFHDENTILAYDVCAANTLLNFLSKQKKLDYDNDGNLARSGKIIPELLDEFNAIEFCKQTAPKSLGTEHVFEHWIALTQKYNQCIEDKLATAVEHIAIQIKNSILSHNTSYNSTILISGGGALNTFLIERIQQQTGIKTVISDILTIQYKEALAIAFFGLLRLLELPNCLASVTGAKKDVIGGAIYLP